MASNLDGPTEKRPVTSTQPAPSTTGPRGDSHNPEDRFEVGKALVFIAPHDADEIRGRRVFLAGSIEQGKARQWQQEVPNHLSDIECTVFNPRRRKWNPGWKQRMDNPAFKQQVDWELDRQEEAEVIVMFFDENTLSPITLLELGLFAESKKLVVCCPEKFYRRGNVEIVCDRHDIPLVETFEELIAELRKRLGTPQ